MATFDLTLDLRGHGTLVMARQQLFAATLRAQHTTHLRMGRPIVRNALTGLADYRVIVVDMYGNQYAEIKDAQIGPIKRSAQVEGGFSFTVVTTDPRIADVAVAEREVQVWRGGRMLGWYVITKARSSTTTVEFTCVTLEWYFGRRLFGMLPRRGELTHPRFESTLKGWYRGRMPGTQPAGAVNAEISNEVVLEGENSLALGPSGGMSTDVFQISDWWTGTSTLNATGKADIDTVLSNTFGDHPGISVNVFHDNTLSVHAAKQLTQDRADAIAEYILSQKPEAIVDAFGHGENSPKTTNYTPAGRAQNRRAKFRYRNDDGTKGHGQYLGQSILYTNPKGTRGRKKVIARGWCYVDDFIAPAMHMWGMVIELQDLRKRGKGPKDGDRPKVVQRQFQPISRATPRKKWVRMEASVMVPPNGVQYQIEVRLFPCYGVTYWDEVDIYVDDGLRYHNIDQAFIARDLIEHAQDPDYRKSSLNIDHNIPMMHRKRTREYVFAEHGQISEALNEFTTLGNGFEWEIVCTPTTRTFTSYYPRKEVRGGYRFQLGQNVLDASSEHDGETTSNVVCIMYNDVDAQAREERAARDDSLLNGITMEMAYTATPNSPVASLGEQAKRGLERYRKVTTVPTLTLNPKYTDEILDRVPPGSIVDVDVRVGWMQMFTKHRVEDMTLDPATEQISVTLHPEDTPVGIVLPYNSTWKYKRAAQSSITGPNNDHPVPSNPEYAARGYDDSAWPAGQAGFGWYIPGSPLELPDYQPKTVIPNKNEVWMRQSVLCTEEMYVMLRVDRFAYVYINGHLLNNRYYTGRNFRLAMPVGSHRVPSSFLHPSGVQVIAVHVQDNLSSVTGSGPSTSLYADVAVRGIYDKTHVSAP